MKEAIRHHSLWKVITDMPARESSGKIPSDKQKNVVIKINEMIEFRYHYGIHFRTTSEKYYFVEEDILRKHCALFGQVDTKIAWENKTGLDEIMKNGLYTKQVTTPKHHTAKACDA